MPTYLGIKYFAPASLLSALLLAAPFADGEINLVDDVLSTERILSFILVYVSVWALPKYIWPWITQQFELRAHSDHEYRMEQLKATIDAEKRQDSLLQTLIKVQAENSEVLGELWSVLIKLKQVEGEETWYGNAAPHHKYSNKAG